MTEAPSDTNAFNFATSKFSSLNFSVRQDTMALASGDVLGEKFKRSEQSIKTVSALPFSSSKYLMKETS